jgi:hypothetical protein
MRNRASRNAQPPGYLAPSMALHQQVGDGLLGRRRSTENLSNDSRALFSDQLSDGARIDSVRDTPGR